MAYPTSRRVAEHLLSEVAGHAVVGIELGLTINEIDLIATEQHLGLTSFAGDDALNPYAEGELVDA